MKKKLYILGALLLATVGVAGPIKVWASNEYITAADINANFAHLHSNLGHGHGAIIVNADVSGSAAIAHTKLASPQLVPKAFGNITCSGSCSLGDTSGIASVTYTSAGVYVVNLSVARTNTNFTALVSSTSSTVVDAMCHGWVASTSTIAIRCVTANTGVALESNFNLIVMDTDN